MSKSDIAKAAEAAIKTQDQLEADRKKAEDARSARIFAHSEKAARLWIPEDLDDLPSFGSFPKEHDFRAIRNRIHRAETEFMELPSETRAMFKNDVANLIGFMEDPANGPTLARLGVLYQFQYADGSDIAKPLQTNTEPPKRPRGQAKTKC